MAEEGKENKEGKGNREEKENKEGVSSRGEYQFINEKIVPKKKSKWKKRCFSLLFTVFLAIVFGVVAQLFFLLMEEPFRELLGMEEQKRQEVELPVPSSRPTKSPTPTATTAPTRRPTPSEAVQRPETDITATQTPVPTPTETERVTPKPIGNGTATGNEDNNPAENITLTPSPDSNEAEGETSKEQTSENGSSGNLNADWYSYAMFYEEIMKQIKLAEKSLVTVEVVEIGVDWFQETYETRSSMTGIILANDGVDLLLLTGTDKLAAADLIEVYLGGQRFEGRVFSMDEDYGLAIVAVPLQRIPKEILQEVQIGKIGTEEQIQLGAPIIALGAPNGYHGSVEFGMITSLGSSVPVTDGQVSYFTTNLRDYAQSYGFVLSINGEVLGMITHKHKANVNDGVSSAISLDAVRGIIVKLLNASNLMHFGIEGENLPVALQKVSGIMQGVYVREVQNASPALAAGIKAGDVLIQAGGTELDGIRTFTNVLLAAKEREVVSVKLLRTTGEGIREITVEVLLTRKKER